MIGKYQISDFRYQIKISIVGLGSGDEKLKLMEKLKIIVL